MSASELDVGRGAGGDVKEEAAMADGPGAAEAMTFDQALAALEQAVAELEAGGQPLERTIELYERGVMLERRCAQLLAEAELRVRRLVEDARGAVTTAEMRLDDQQPG
ncbi:MAG: exodeoxyribonuclease VII small subunit [Chloroflexi bacterium]|jgi:exodeoxyribonuclease VII small subunit|nr:exodeoxyribonuclease VII small subunit [Chloroflexota bacterium]